MGPLFQGRQISRDVVHVLVGVDRRQRAVGLERIAHLDARAGALPREAADGAVGQCQRRRRSRRSAASRPSTFSPDGRVTVDGDGARVRRVRRRATAAAPRPPRPPALPPDTQRFCSAFAIGDSRGDALEIAGRRMAGAALRLEVDAAGGRIADEDVEDGGASLGGGMPCRGDSAAMLWMYSAIAFMSSSGIAIGGMPLSGRPPRMTGMIASPFWSPSTSCDRSRFGPVQLAAAQIRAVAQRAGHAEERLAARDHRRIAGRTLLRRKHTRARVRDPAPGVPEPAGRRRLRRRRLRRRRLRAERRDDESRGSHRGRDSSASDAYPLNPTSSEFR